MHKIFEKDNKIMSALLNKVTVNSISDKPPLYWINSRKGLKLRMKSIPLSSASVLYHRFFRENKVDDYDPYLIATTALYLASKTEDAHVSLRDIVNVSYRTLHRDKPPLEMGDTYWSLRDTIVNCELFLLRSLQFKAVVYHPHKFLLHYLKFLKDWFDPYTWETVPVTQTCWSLLRDSYHCPLALRFRPRHIAIAIVYFSLLSLGVEVPYNRQADVPWWKVFSEDISLNEIKDIINMIIATYDLETGIKSTAPLRPVT